MWTRQQHSLLHRLHKWLLVLILLVNFPLTLTDLNRLEVTLHLITKELCQSQEVSSIMTHIYIVFYYSVVLSCKHYRWWTFHSLWKQCTHRQMFQPCNSNLLWFRVLASCICSCNKESKKYPNITMHLRRYVRQSTYWTINHCNQFSFIHKSWFLKACVAIPSFKATDNTRWVELSYFLPSSVM